VKSQQSIEEKKSYQTRSNKLQSILTKSKHFHTKDHHIA